MIALELLTAPPSLVEVSTTGFVLDVLSQGLQGPPGIAGAQGPPGPSLGDYDPGDLTLAFDNALL